MIKVEIICHNPEHLKIATDAAQAVLAMINSKTAGIAAPQEPAVAGLLDMAKDDTKAPNELKQTKLSSGITSESAVSSAPSDTGAFDHDKAKLLTQVAVKKGHREKVVALLQQYGAQTAMKLAEADVGPYCEALLAMEGVGDE